MSNPQGKSTQLPLPITDQRTLNASLHVVDWRQSNERSAKREESKETKEIGKKSLKGSEHQSQTSRSLYLGEEECGVTTAVVVGPERALTQSSVV